MMQRTAKQAKKPDIAVEINRTWVAAMTGERRGGVPSASMDARCLYRFSMPGTRD
jgi:hypothetical protein